MTFPAWAPRADRHGPDPSSADLSGERRLQQRMQSEHRADRFYDEQMLDHLNPLMRAFVRRARMFFLATADGSGACDSTLRAGSPGFLEVVDERTVTWPEFRGNGVHASLGNISENPHVGLLIVDFVEDQVGLHVNGRAELVEAAAMARHGFRPGSPAGHTTRLWVRVAVEEAYIHCSKHIPRMADVPAEQAAGERRNRTADYFGARAASRRTSDDSSAAS